MEATSNVPLWPIDFSSIDVSFSISSDLLIVADVSHPFSPNDPYNAILLNPLNESLSRDSPSGKEKALLTKKLEGLSKQRLKLMEAYYEDIITKDVLKLEQDRISSEISIGERRLEVLEARVDYAADRIQKALEMAASCSAAYMRAKPETRRLFNQTFFKKIYVLKDEQIDKTEFTDPFDPFFNGSLTKCSMVEIRGLEPLTSALRTRRSPS